MKITTIIKLYEVLVNDGYKTKIQVIIFNDTEYCYIKLTFQRGTYKESLYSDTCNTKYVLKNLEGIPFESKEKFINIVRDK